MHNRFQIVARFASALVLLIATLAVAGWLLDIQRLTTFQDAYPHMSFNTALCFILAALPLLLWGLEPPRGWANFFYLLCVSIVFVLSCLTFAQYILRQDLGIDLLFHSQMHWQEPGTFVGRMVPSTAINLVFLSSALLLCRLPKVSWMGQVLACVIGLHAMLAFLGYCYNVQELRSYGRYISMSLPTSIAFCLSVVAFLFYQPNRGTMSLISSNGVAGVVARRLLPMVLLVSPILGFLRLYGERLHLYGRNLGTALLVVSHVTLFVMLILLVLRRLAALETARALALEAQRRSAEEFEALFDRSAVGQSQNDPVTGRFLRVNAETCRITGYSKTDLLQMTFSQVTHPEDRTLDFERFQQAVQGQNKELATEKRYVRKDGQTRWVQVNVVILRNGSGAPIQTMSVIQDITARKDAEQALACENAALELERSRLRAVLEALPIGVFISDAGGKLIHANKAGKQIWGGATPLSESPETYGYDYKAWWPNGRPVASHEWGLARVLANGKPCSAEEMDIQAKDGTHKTILNYALPIRQGDGTLTGGVAVNVDITDRKRAEESLRESAKLQRLRAEVAELLAKGRPDRPVQELLQAVTQAIVDQMGAAFARVWTLDAAGTTLELQASAGMYTHLNGGHARVPVGQYKIGLIAQERRPHLTNQALGDPRVHDQEWARNHGLVSFAGYPLVVRQNLYGVVALFSRSPLSVESFDALAAVAALLGQALARKKVEAALRQSEAALRQESERSRLLTEATGQLLSASNSASMIRDLFERVGPALNLDAYFNFLADHNQSELRLDSCAGIPEETALALQPLQFGQAVCGAVAESHQALVVTHVQQSAEPKAQMIRSLGIRAYACFPLLIDDHLIGTLSFASRSRDFFEEDDLRFMRTLSNYVALAQERANYLQELEARVVERTARLQETIGDLEHFSYSITHDMRAPLRAMQGFSRLLLGSMGDDPSARNDFLHRIAEAADRMDRLIRDALDYSKVVKAELPMAPLDPAAVIRAIVASNPDFQRPHAEIWIEGHLPLVIANETGLSQCFANLMANAVKFHKPGERPAIKIRAETFSVRRVENLDAWQTEADSPGKPFQRVRIWVEDNGIGIPRDSHERIFQMFQRLSRDYEGTGIGLALVRKVVERMGGKVGVESEPGKGSHFWLDLRGVD